MSRPRTWTAAVALGFVLLAAGGAWGAGSAVQIRRIETGSFPKIGVTVSVEGALSPGDVSVEESGQAADVLSVRPLLQSGGELDVVLAIDVSDSVAGSALAQAVQAAEQLVRTVPPSVPIGVVTFSDKVRVLSPITPDHGAVSKALASITETRAGTALYDGVVAAADMFSGPAQHNLVLLTDGTDIGSKADLPAAIDALKNASVVAFSVGLQGKQRTTFPALQQMSEATKGTFNLATGSSLSALYAQLGRAISQQWRIEYRSNSAAGAQVTITVRTPLGSDSSTTLIPRGANALGAGEPGVAFLRGPLGLAIVLLLTFAAAFLLGTTLFGQRVRTLRDRELARRMAAKAAADPTLPERPDAGISSWIPQPFVQVGDAVAEVGGFKSSMDRMLERAALPITPGEVVAGMFMLGLVGLGIGWFVFGNALIALPLAVVGGSIPYFLLARKVTKRVNLLHSQLPDVLMILASSMRAGHSFLQALDTVSKEIGEPSAPEFARVLTEVRLGRPFDQAMTALADRVGTEEFKWAVLGINVQREVGGNLAEILDILAETVREREAIHRQVKVLSAEGRMSVKILIVMPFLITGYLVLVSPEYMRLLWTTHLGIGFIVAGAILMVAGAFWARKVVKIDV